MECNNRYDTNLTRSWTSPSSKLREIVGLKQNSQSFPPVLLEHQIVPFGNDVSEGTAGVGLTEWHSTVHAPSSLHSQSIQYFFVVVDLSPVTQAVVRSPVLVLGSLVFNKSSEICSKF